MAAKDVIFGADARQRQLPVQRVQLKHLCRQRAAGPLRTRRRLMPRGAGRRLITVITAQAQ